MNESVNSALPRPLDRLPTENKIVPKIIYASELQDPSVKYSIEVNPQLLGQLLHENGMKDKDIEKLTIKITRGKSLLEKIAWGRYDPISSTVNIYCDSLWDTYSKALTIAEKIVTGKATPKDNQFSELIKTKRLARYLAEAPPERALKFAKSLLTVGLNNQTRNTAIHESQHAIDFKSKYAAVFALAKLTSAVALTLVGEGFGMSELMLANLVFKIPNFSQLINNDIFVNIALAGMGLTFGVGVEYLIDPLEVSARKFAKHNMYDSKWDDIIKITPKNEFDTPSGRLENIKSK